MSVQHMGNRHDSFLLIERLARRIMDQLGRGHRWKDEEMTWMAPFQRASDMSDTVLFRYTEYLMRNDLDMEELTRGIILLRREGCMECYCDLGCEIDHSAHITLRDIMIYLVCEAVVEEIDETRWDYFDEVA